MGSNPEYDAAFYLRCLELGYSQPLDSLMLVTLYMMAVHDPKTMSLVQNSARQTSELGQKAYYQKLKELTTGAIWQNEIP